jgi:hypothetical protein
MSGVSKLGRALATVFGPGPSPPPLGETETRARLRARVGIIVQFGVANLLLFLMVRKNPEFDHVAVDRFFAYVGATLVLDVVVSLACMGKPGRALRVSLPLCAFLETISVVIWIWSTGIVSSYFCLAPMIFIALYRSIYDHAVALTSFLTAFVGLLAAQHLQRAGVLAVAPLLAHPQIGSYATRAYEDATMPNILILLVLTFAGTNVAAHQAVRQARELAEAKAKLAALSSGQRRDDA